MKWFANILIAIATFQMALTPAFAGSTNSAHNAKDYSQVAEYREHLAPMGYSLEMDKANDRALVYDKDKKLVMEIPFIDKANALKYTPNKVNKGIMDEMIRIKKATNGVFSHTVKNFAPESAMFFMAMGAVVASQLITNYSQNPLGLEHHIAHSLSPVGVIGFFTFMYSQGVTSNVLSMYMKNPRFHHMIPYLGMTVGAFIQSYMSQIASDPNVIACAKVSIGKKLTDQDYESGVDQDPCGKAYEYLVVHKKIWEFAPGIASMLISTAIAGTLQKGLTSAVLKLSGVDLALYLTPGTMQLKGMRMVLVKGLQLTVFVSLDVLLNRAVTYAWKNMYDGADFYDSNDAIIEQINLQKKNNWQNDPKELVSELKLFKKRMSDWRMMNMSSVYEAHQNWSQALQQLTSMYNSSHAFYGDFVNQIRSARFKEETMPNLQKVYLFNGVTAKDQQTGFEDEYHNKPSMVEHSQHETIEDVGQLGLKMMKMDWAKSLFENERAKLQSIFTKLSSGKRDVMAAGLNEIRAEYVNNMQNISVSLYYRQMVQKVFSDLGGPRPVLEPGRGFLFTYEAAPTTGKTLKGTNFYRKVGQFQTPTITDYFVMQMMCGPDSEKAQSSVRQSMGFASVFLPPQIKNGTDSFKFCEGPPQISYSENEIYSTPVTTSTNKKYLGMIAYLVNEARTSIVGDQTTPKFEDWWQEKTETQMQTAFAQFSKSYDEIVVKLIKGIYEPGRSIFNGRPLIRNPVKTFEAIYTEKGRARQLMGGPIYNGAMNAVFQEERVYLKILEEILNPAKEFNVDFANILQKSPAHPMTQAIEEEFAKLNALIKKIKVTKVGDREVVNSELENTDIEKQVTNIQNMITALGRAVGVSDAVKTKGNAAPSQQEAPIMNLTENQKMVTVQMLEALQGLATEMMMYGTIANAVSWDKIRNLKKSQEETLEQARQLKEQVDSIRGNRLGR